MKTKLIKLRCIYKFHDWDIINDGECPVCGETNIHKENNCLIIKV